MDTPTAEVMCPKCNVPMVNGVCPQCGMRAEDIKTNEHEAEATPAEVSSEEVPRESASM